MIFGAANIAPGTAGIRGSRVVPFMRRREMMFPLSKRIRDSTAITHVLSASMLRCVNGAFGTLSNPKQKAAKFSVPLGKRGIIALKTHSILPGVSNEFPEMLGVISKGKTY